MTYKNPLQIKKAMTEKTSHVEKKSRLQKLKTRHESQSNRSL